MVFQDHITVYGQPVVLLQVAPRVEDDLHGFRPCEDGEPADHSAGQEVRILGLEDLVTATGHGRVLGQCGTQSVRACVPTRSVGTRDSSKSGNPSSPLWMG